jgi:hypothetical protein
VFDALPETDGHISGGDFADDALDQRRLANPGGAADERDPALTLACRVDHDSDVRRGRGKVVEP